MLEQWRIAFKKYFWQSDLPIKQNGTTSPQELPQHPHSEVDFLSEYSNNQTFVIVDDDPNTCHVGHFKLNSIKINFEMPLFRSNPFHITWMRRNHLRADNVILELQKPLLSFEAQEQIMWPLFKSLPIILYTIRLWYRWMNSFTGTTALLCII